MSKIDTNVLHDGQLAVATVDQSGTITKKSAINTNILVQTEDGEQLCVATYPLNGGGGGGGGSSAETTWFNGVNGTTLNTGLTGSKVRVFINGLLAQPGQSITAKLYKGGSGKSIALSQTAPLQTANSWSFETELLWDNSNSGTTPCVLCYTGLTDYLAPVIIYEVKMGWYLGSTGYSWDLDTANNSSLDLPETGYLYDFKAEFTGTSYILSYRKNGSAWQIARQFNSTAKVYCSVPFLLLNSEANPSRGYNGSTLNMSKTKITVDGTTWFDGATAVEGTDYTNNGCTLTEVPSSTNDYYYNPTTGVITFAEEIVNGTVAVEHSL